MRARVEWDVHLPPEESAWFACAERSGGEEARSWFSNRVIDSVGSRGMGKGQIEVAEQSVVGKDGVTRKLQEEHDDPMERVPYWVAFTTYFGYTWLILIGFLRDVIGRRILRGGPKRTPGYAPLLEDFEDFFQRRLYMRTHDVFDRPICSAPGPYIDVMLRDFQLLQPIGKPNGETKRCLNLGSYNYLGFGARVPLSSLSPTRFLHTKLTGPRVEQR